MLAQLEGGCSLCVNLSRTTRSEVVMPMMEGIVSVEYLGREAFGFYFFRVQLPSQKGVE